MKIMSDLYNPKESFDKYVTSARDSLHNQKREAAVEDVLCALEELQAWMEKVEAQLNEK